jgi:hypothetical protein
MIGRAEWFERRKYGGWGLRPKTWQGWAYIAVFIIPFIIFQSIPLWDNLTRVIVTVLWLGLLFIDTMQIMFHLKKDEFESKAEAYAERNVAWVMVIIVTAGIVYQIIRSGLEGRIDVDWFLVIALFAGVLTKSLSNIYYDKRGV